MPGAEKIRIIKGNLAKLAKDRGALREELKDFFQYWLKQGERQFKNRLATQAVSEHFQDTIASRRLYKSFNTDLSKALRIGRDGNLTFAFSINSTGKRGFNDPSQYYVAIDDANRREGGPSVDRVIEWMYERGIAKRGRKTVDTPSGKRKRISVRSLAFIIQRKIKEKTARKQYKSLRLTEMLVDIINVKDPNSDFRETLRGRVSNLVMRGAR